ncbi:DUF4245 domain-containing protein [Kitasatospora sp. NBC_01250]|uniref:DUF4245 domain-containing protein n=1 Tax=unclassified Kitasatospora TaxID=2633591 RepID=UPI002E0D6C00|nr:MULTISPECIES: DUF4245 domain-containing protein [unclassified Kitasatospora]WSJ69003.1 DUF4245 domain-containing protein [Kitasatospora sp. NBC_01302]
MVHHVGVAASSRGRQTVRDMILSMVAVMGVALVAYLTIPHSTDGDPVHVVDYSAALASAKRAAPYPIAAPEGLSDKWRATSVTYQPSDAEGHAGWHLGFVTPDGKYAAVEQSNAPKADLLKSIVTGYAPDGSATIAGQDWSRYQGDSYRGLTVTSGSDTTLVTGSASYQELGELAQALKS